MFDPNQFLDMQVAEANDTKVIPVPVGEYTGVIEKVDARQWVKKDDPTVSGVALDITWIIEDEGVKQLKGMQKVTCRQGIMLDMTESGGLDFGRGKNVGLGRLREAVGLNQPGQPFSFTMLVGRMSKVKVAHEIYNNEPMAKITAVAKL